MARLYCWYISGFSFTLWLISFERKMSYHRVKKILFPSSQMEPFIIPFILLRLFFLHYPSCDSSNMTEALSFLESLTSSFLLSPMWFKCPWSVFLQHRVSICIVSLKCCAVIACLFLYYLLGTGTMFVQYRHKLTN